MSGIHHGVLAAAVTGVAGSESWTTAGTYSFTVPPGIYSVSINASGGGGAGGGADGGTNFNGYGGGGGGSNLKGITSYAVSPGQVLSVTVGAGGIANSGNGGASSVSGTGVAYSADGGSGGQSYVSNSGVSAWAGAGVYGADYPTSTTSRTYNPGVSFNGGSDGGRGGNAPNYTPGLNGQDGKVYITY